MRDNTSTQTKDNFSYLHLNSLWSIWYGILITLFQGYLAVHGAYRFLGCSLIEWKDEPIIELNIQIILCGVVFTLLPLFFASAVFKVGNIANDGIKLATIAKCSLSPQEGLEEESKGGTVRALWTHGGPTAVFIHILIALCLLIPKLLLEAKVIENGFLPRENIWRNELDFLSWNRNGFVVLSFMTSNYQNSSANDTRNILWNENFTDTFSSEENDYKIIYSRLPFDDNPDLIEKFRPDHEFMNSHENIELRMSNNSMESIELTTSSESSSPSSSLSSLWGLHKKLSISSPKETENSLSNPNIESSTIKNFISTPTSMRRTTIKSSTISSTPTLTTTKISMKTNASSPVTQTIPNGNVTPTSVFAQNSPIHRSNGKLRSENRRNGRPNRKHHHKGNRYSGNNSHEDRRLRVDEFDQNLELKRDHSIDFNRFDEVEMSTIFENNSNLRFHPTTPKYVPNGSGEYQGSTTSGSKRQNMTKTTFVKDSHIHIVKPEKLPEIIPATPISSNSKIIEIKTKKITKRSTKNQLVQVKIEPEYLIATAQTTKTNGSSPDTGMPSLITPSTLTKLDGFSGMLQRFFRVEKPINVNTLSYPCSMEFLNLVISLLIWSIRYPAVFWSTTKSFSIIFSIQMLANSIDIILSYVGISILYKLLIIGPVFSIRSSTLLLNAVVALSLFILSVALTIASSLIIYLYGHGKLAAQIRDRSMITAKSTESWIYFAHCASLCMVLALTVVKAPIIHDLSKAYKESLNYTLFVSALCSVTHLFLWILIWLGLAAKRRWNFKLPPLEQFGRNSRVSEPLLISSREQGLCSQDCKGIGGSTAGGPSVTSSADNLEDSIYWPKLTPSSPKLKVTFNDTTSTSEDVLIIGEHDGKRNTTCGTALRIASITREIDDGDYATLRAGVSGGGVSNINGGQPDISTNVITINSDNVRICNDNMNLSEYDELPPPPIQLLPSNHNNNAGGGAGDIVNDDNTSEEGKLLACVRDDSVTYASTKDLEPPCPTLNSRNLQPCHDNNQIHDHRRNLNSPEQLISPLAPVTITVHTNEAHITNSISRCLRRADSGMPNEALTPRSDTTSTTESTISPPERAPSDSSSGIHSGEEREEVVIRPRSACKMVSKQLPPPAIQEEPYGRSTNMKMSSFVNEGIYSNTIGNSTINNNNDTDEKMINGCGLSKTSATLPLTRATPEQRIDYLHCNTMPLPVNFHQQICKPQVYTPTSTLQHVPHTTLPNGVRYSNHLIRRIPHVIKSESPYGHLGLGSGHHTFSKLLQDPLHGIATSTIPENQDSSNYSLISEQDYVYVNTQHIK